MYTKFTLSPSLTGLHAKSGNTESGAQPLVIVMPRLFETEREVMQMEQMAGGGNRYAGALPGAGAPAAAMPRYEQCVCASARRPLSTWC